jgi:hypothetical protein
MDSPGNGNGNGNGNDRERELDREIDRYREASLSALGQLEWVVGYLYKHEARTPAKRREGRPEDEPHATVAGFSIQTAGVIVMVAGVMGLVIGLFLLNSRRGRTAERTVYDDRSGRTAYEDRALYR